MKKELLATWLEKQLRAHTSRDLSKALGVSPQGLFRWRSMEVKRLSEKSLQSLADYKGESLEDVCKWLDVPTPAKSLLVTRIEQLEREVRDLKALAA